MIHVGFDPVIYFVNETEGVVTVCISAMDTLTGGTLSVTLTTEPGTASGMFIQGALINMKEVISQKDAFHSNTFNSFDIDLLSVGEDYSPAFEILTFTSAPSQVYVNISILNDAVAEQQETFGVRLSTADQSVNLTWNTEATVIINDNSGRETQSRPVIRWLFWYSKRMTVQ